MSPSQRRPAIGLAVLLAFLSTASPFAIDSSLPSFRAIQQDFQVSPLAVQQLLTLYMLPYAVMSLFYGPLSDALGRRRVVLIGMGGFALASLACTLAPSFETLLLFRIGQGLTGGSGMSVARAVIRDRYEGPAAQRMMSVVTILFTLAPALAPLIGGWIQTVLGWRGVFGFLSIVGIAMLWSSWAMLEESHPPERRLAFHPVVLARAVWEVARHREFQWLAAANAFLHGGMMILIGAAPAIVLDHWHLDETRFVMLFVPVVAGFIAGAAISGRLAGRIHSSRQLALGFGTSLLGAILASVMHQLVDAPPLLQQQFLIAICACGVQIAAPALTLRLLDLFPDTRGSVSSAQVFASLLFGGLAMGIVAPMLAHSLVMLKAWMTFAFALAWILWRMAERHAAR